MNAGLVSSRSYNIHPDDETHRETPLNDFYNINGQINTNEGPNNGI